MRTLLSGALASLEQPAPAQPAGMVEDLSSRLPESENEPANVTARALEGPRAAGDPWRADLAYLQRLPSNRAPTSTVVTNGENPATMRIGAVAARTGLTPRAIRHYEQIGVLPDTAGRLKGGHRQYGEDDVQRLLMITRMRDLLGLSLDDLDELVAKGGPWQVPEREWQESESSIDRLAVVDAATARIDLQLSLVQARRDALAALEQDLLVLRQAVDAKRL